MKINEFKDNTLVIKNKLDSLNDQLDKLNKQILKKEESK